MKMARFFAAFCIVAAGLVAAAPAEDINLIPNRLSFAKVGEWASYKLPSGYIQKLTVSKRSGEGPDALVSIMVENIYDGTLVEAKEITEPAGDAFSSPRVPADPGVFVAVRNETVNYKGKDYVISVVEFNRGLGTEEQDVTEWWSNSEIPVFGIVKKTENGETAWELSDWGYSDGRVKKVVYEDGQVKVVDADPIAASPAGEAKESLRDKAANAAKAVGNAAARAKDVVAEKAATAAGATGDAVRTAAGAVAEGTTDAVKAAGEALDRAGDVVAEKTAGARSVVGEAAAEVRDAVKDTAAGAARVAGDAYDSAKAKITQEAKAADEAVENAEGSLRPSTN